MNKFAMLFLPAMIIAMVFTGCGWKPEVTAVPITTPWNTMNLPVTENAVVWASSPVEIKVVHKDDKKTVMGKYTDAFKAQGWSLDKFDDKSVATTYYIDMSKGPDKLHLEIYDFHNTGVIIKKQ